MISALSPMLLFICSRNPCNSENVFTCCLTCFLKPEIKEDIKFIFFMTDMRETQYISQYKLYNLLKASLHLFGGDFSS